MLTFDLSNFNAQTLTTRANDATIFPYVATDTASEFEVGSITTQTAQVDRAKFTAKLMSKGTFGQAPAASGSTRTKGTFPVNSIKIDDRVVVSSTDFASVRTVGQTKGDAAALETFQSIVDQNMEEKFTDMEYTKEFLRMTTILGSTLDPSDGTSELITGGFGQLYGVSAAIPAVIELQLDEASPKKGALKTRFTNALREIEKGLGAKRGTKYVARYGVAAWDALREHAEMRDAFDRVNDGEFKREEGRKPVTYAGIEHYEYAGPALAPHEVVIYPVGVRGMLKVDYSFSDAIEFVNTPGLPRYVIPQWEDSSMSAFMKGAEWEVASHPVFINMLPEAVVRANGVAAA